MTFRLAADLVALAHFVFVLFVVFGAFFVLRRPGLVWFHLPAAIWGALIEFTGWVCPLTPLENHLRSRAGSVGYGGGFVEHYLLPVLYPAGLSRSLQIGLGIAVLMINASAYGWLLWRRATRDSREP